jgi:hypothetical protein
MTFDICSKPGDHLTQVKRRSLLEVPEILDGSAFPAFGERQIAVSQSVP